MATPNAIAVALFNAAAGAYTGQIASDPNSMANAAGLTMISPTVTTSALVGQDDQFFRVISSTREYAQASARFHAQRSRLLRLAAVLAGAFLFDLYLFSQALLFQGMGQRAHQQLGALERIAQSGHELGDFDRNFHSTTFRKRSERHAQNDRSDPAPAEKITQRAGPIIWFSGTKPKPPTAAE